MKPIDSTEYARRVVAIQDRIERMHPYPEDADLNWGDYKIAHYHRERKLRRILELPKRWRALPKERP